MRRGWLVVSTFGIACSGPQRPASAPTADLVLTNGVIYTGDAAHPRAEALAIAGETIVAVGTNAELARYATARRIDLGGRLVIPGINDAHVHEPELDNAMLAGRVELPGEFDTQTVPELLATIERATREHPAGTWLRGVLSRAAIDDPALTREALDKVAPGHPVWLDNFAGHALVLNSAALRAARIDPAAPPPRGGFIGRNTDGIDDGWRFEYARYAAMRGFGAAVSDADVLAAVVDFEARAAAFGITSVQTFPTQLEPARLDQLLRGSQRSLRWHVMRLPVGEIIAPPHLLALVEQGLPSSPKVQGMVTFFGTKYFLDGTPIERGAALHEPYSDVPRSGRRDFDAIAIREMLVRARASGDPLHLHISGDAQLRTLLDAMDELRPKNRQSPGGDWRDQRVVIEHGDAIAPADLARVNDLGIVVVQNPSHLMPAELNRVRLGARVERWMPMRSLIEAGIPFALGSDGPLNPYLNILFATQHPTNPREAITREQALVAYTHGAAYDERAEGFKGRLVAGAAADLAVLTQDIFGVPADALPNTRSVLTIVAGRVVLDRLGAANPASGPSSARTE